MLTSTIVSPAMQQAGIEAWRFARPTHGSGCFTKQIVTAIYAAMLDVRIIEAKAELAEAIKQRG